MFRSRENRDFSHICRSRFFLNPYFSIPQSESFSDVPGLKADQQMVSRMQRVSPAWPSLSKRSVDDSLLSLWFMPLGRELFLLSSPVTCRMLQLPGNRSWCVCVGGVVYVCVGVNKACLSLPFSSEYTFGAEIQSQGRSKANES